MREKNLWSEEYADGGLRHEWFRATVAMLRARARTLDDFSVNNRAFWSDEYPLDSKAQAKNLGDPKTVELLAELGRRYEALDPFTLETAESTLRSYADEAGVKAGILINGSRTLLTGSPVGPGIFDVMMALGQERTARRLVNGLQSRER